MKVGMNRTINWAVSFLSHPRECKTLPLNGGAPDFFEA